ncbi:unnamed protein product [Prunus armeniaca]
MSLPHTKASDGPNIWEARNNCIFKDIDPHPVRALNVAGRIGLDYWKINSCPPQKFTGRINIKWKPLPLDWVKVNFDGLVHVAKCLALRDGLAHAIHKGWQKILVEGDSKLIIDCVNNLVSVPWSISLLVQDIRLLSSYCKEVSFQHIFREANFTADAIASLGRSLTLSRLWDRGLLLSCSVPFYFDLYSHVFTDEKIILLLFYVDDMLIVCQDMSKVQELKNLLRMEFEMKDLGAAQKIL